MGYRDYEDDFDYQWLISKLETEEEKNLFEKAYMTGHGMGWSKGYVEGFKDAKKDVK